MKSEPIVKEVSPTTGRTRYRVTVDAGRDPATGRRRQRKQRFDTLKAARLWLAETRVKVANGTYQDETPLTVTQHLERWVAGRRDLAPTTRRNYSDALRPFREVVGAVPLKSLTREQVEAVVDGMEDGSLRHVGRPGTPLSPRSISLALTVLRSALNDAMEEGLPRNVALKVKGPPSTRAKGKVWGPAELERFLRTAQGDRLYAAWLLTSYGLRRGEVLGLAWDAVNFDTEEITVRAARVYYLGDTIDAKVKTEDSWRVLPMPGELAAALAWLRQRQVAERALVGPTYNVRELVVVDAAGDPLRAEHYSDRFQLLSSTAGLPRIRLHDVRAASVSRARAAGQPDHVVAQWHGHSEEIMKDVYSRATRDDLRRYAESM